MILDQGTCKIYKITNTAGAGEMPNENKVKIAERWFGDLDFSSAPTQYTESLEQIEVSRKIRVLRVDEIVMKKTIVEIGTEAYMVDRVYNGTDEESGERISDISLSKVVGAYDTV